ncbi:MAG: UDP binding domain-containing protein, partial [Candidatus Sericytochromatia bacterium]
GHDLKGKTIGVLGLAFKPNTDDMRGAPSAEIIPMLQELEATVKVYDPVAHETAKEVLRDVEYCANPYEVAEGADCVLLLTEWSEFHSLNLPYMKTLLKRPLIVDGRNFFEPRKMTSLGYEYYSIGRPDEAIAESRSQNSELV